MNSIAADDCTNKGETSKEFRRFERRIKKQKKKKGGGG